MKPYCCEHACRSMLGNIRITTESFEVLQKEAVTRSSSVFCLKSLFRWKTMGNNNYTVLSKQCLTIICKCMCSVHLVSLSTSLSRKLKRRHKK